MISLFSLQEFTPRIYLSEEDFAVMTLGGTLLDPEGQLRLDKFEELMRDQMRQYVLRQLTNTLNVGAQCVAVEAIQLTTMKAVLHEQVALLIMCSTFIKYLLLLCWIP